jgi:hypothetical protein
MIHLSTKLLFVQDKVHVKCDWSEKIYNKLKKPMGIAGPASNFIC